MRPEVADSETAAARVRRQLSDRIATGTLHPGDRVVDTAIADELSVSRNTVRDALKLLEVDGLVTTRRNAGFTVRRLEGNDVRDIYGARRIIELGGVATAPAASLERRDAMLIAAERTMSAVETAEWNVVGTYSLGFHRAIVSLAGVPTLDRLFDVLRAQLRLAFAVMTDEAEFQRQWAPRDLEIARAVHAGLTQRATDLLRAYLDDSEAQVLDAIGA